MVWDYGVEVIFGFVGVGWGSKEGVFGVVCERIEERVFDIGGWKGGVLFF